MFNTGQIINGLLEWHKYVKEEIVLEAALRAGRWMTSIQEDDGSWNNIHTLVMFTVILHMLHAG